MAYKKKTPEPKDTTKLIDKLVGWFDSSWKYQQNYHPRWEKDWKLCNNIRTDRAYQGVSDVFVPMTHSTIEAMTSALAGGKPSFDFLPPQDRQDQKTDILNALLDFYWDKDQWTPKIESFIRDCLVYGTSVAYLYWDSDHPVLLNIPIRDFFFDPNATSIENCAPDFYCGRRYLTTIDELKSYEVVDPETGEMKPRFKNLDDVTDRDSSGERTDKETKDMFYGSTVDDPEKHQVEVLEFWSDDRTYSVANRKIVIEDTENPFKTEHRKRLVERYSQVDPMLGFDPNVVMAEAERRADMEAKGIIPFILQRDYADPSLLLGRGEVETIAPLQEWLNDHTNQTADFMSFVLNPALLADPALKDMIAAGAIQLAPGVVIPARLDQIQPLVLPQLPPAAFALGNNIKNEIRETTAASEVVKGVSSDTKVTATEINAQVAQAGARIKMKAVRLENEAFHRLARIVFEMVKLYVTDPMSVRVVTDRVDWQTFDPAEFDGNYEPRVQLETSVEAKKNEDMNVAKEMYLALAMDPAINQEELKRIALPKMFDLDPDEVDRLLTKPRPDPMAMGINPMGDPALAGMAPTAPLEGPGAML